MQQPLVSICIPCFNVSRFVAETIDSVLQQTYSNLEIIICDDRSTDDTVDIIRTFKDPRITLYRNEQNLGCSGNYAQALSYATGIYVKLLCADDIISPDCIEKQVEIFEKYPCENIAFVTAHKNIINETGKKLFTRKIKGKGFIAGKKAISKSIRAGTNIFGEPGCPLIKREIFLKTSGVITDPYFTYCNDFDLLLKLLLHGNLYIIDEALFSFRIVKTSVTSKSGWKQAKIVKDYFSIIVNQKEYGISKTTLFIGKFMVNIIAFIRNIICKFV